MIIKSRLFFNTSTNHSFVPLPVAQEDAELHEALLGGRLVPGRQQRAEDVAAGGREEKEERREQVGEDELKKVFSEGKNQGITAASWHLKGRRLPRRKNLVQVTVFKVGIL